MTRAHYRASVSTSNAPPCPNCSRNRLLPLANQLLLLPKIRHIYWHSSTSSEPRGIWGLGSGILVLLGLSQLKAGVVQSINPAYGLNLAEDKRETFVV